MKSYPCPLCKKLTPWTDNPFRPFCSERCKMIDLGHWAAGDYRVPDAHAPDPEDPTAPVREVSESEETETN